MVASGDVLLRFGPRAAAVSRGGCAGAGHVGDDRRRAKDFGVFFCPRQRPTELAFFLQKPVAGAHPRTGRGLLLPGGHRHVAAERAGRRGAHAPLRVGCASGFRRRPAPATTSSTPSSAWRWAPRPTERDPEVNALTCAVVPLPEARVLPLRHQPADDRVHRPPCRTWSWTRPSWASSGAKRHPDRLPAEHAASTFPLRPGARTTRSGSRTASSRGSWHLASEHVLTGVPENAWDLRLEPGVCLDFVPVGERRLCVRAYGMDDDVPRRAGRRRHALARARRPGLVRARASICAGRTPAWIRRPTCSRPPLFPVLRPDAAGPAVPRMAVRRHARAERRTLHASWCAARRLSAAGPRRAGQPGAALPAAREPARGLLCGRCCELPLERLLPARPRVHRRAVSPRATHPLPRTASCRMTIDLEPLHAVHDQMFRSAVLRHRRQAGLGGARSRAPSPGCAR